MTSAALRWWKQRSARERWLAAAVVLIGVGATVEVGLLAPLRAESERLSRSLVQSRARLQQLVALAAQQASAGEAELGKRRVSIEERRTRAIRTIVEANIDLITPTEMSRQLEAILVRQPTLRIVGMNASAPKPLVENTAGAKTAAAGVYQHGLEVQIEGPYLDLLGYLEALERAPYRLYWRELDLRVNASGLPVTRLVFFTLSKEAEWLRL